MKVLFIHSFNESISAAPVKVNEAPFVLVDEVSVETKEELLDRLCYTLGGR